MVCSKLLPTHKYKICWPLLREYYTEMEMNFKQDQVGIEYDKIEILHKIFMNANVCGRHIPNTHLSKQYTI
jgi:hypothetical protein